MVQLVSYTIQILVTDSVFHVGWHIVAFHGSYKHEYMILLLLSLLFFSVTKVWLNLNSVIGAYFLIHDDSWEQLGKVVAYT